MGIRFTANTAYLSSTTDLPSESAFSMQVWAVQFQDTNAFSNVISLDNGGDALAIETDVDGSTFHLYTPSAQTNFNIQPVIRTPFCVCLTGDGTTVSGYMRRAGDRAWDIQQITRAAFTPSGIGVGIFRPSASAGMRGAFWNFKVWDRALTDKQLMAESLSNFMQDTRDGNRFWRMQHPGDLLDYGPRGQRRPTRNGTPQPSAWGPASVGLLNSWRPASRRVDASAVASTRGIAFANRGTAFNGGRTFVGPIN